MFGFDVKQIFKESIYEIIFLLCSMHLGAVMVSFILKWVHPYLKRCSVMQDNYEKVDSDNTGLNSEQLKALFNNQHLKKKNKNCYENKTTMSEEYASIINYLETCLDISSIPQEILKKQYNKGNVLNELSLEIDNAINIRKHIRDKLKKRKITSEAQTNITINPIMKTDCTSPQLIFSYDSKSCEIPLHISESSDSFETVTNHSESEVSKGMPNNHRVCMYDQVTSQDKCRKIHKTETVKQEALLNINSLPLSNTKVLKAHVENHYGYEKQVSQENKILEMAINEFENELKPIKDQIKVLKECLHNFDCCETDDSFVSDFSSSVSDDPITQSERHSEEMSAVYNSDLKSFSSNRFKMLEQNGSSLKARLQHRPNSCKPTFDENNPILSKYNAKNNTLTSYKMLHPVEKYSRCPKEICILEISQSENNTHSYNKLSPIADMYIKLSNCSSQTANFVKNSSYIHTKFDKSVTCRINLNFSLGTVTLSGTSIKNRIKEREMQPVLSEPEDMISKLSHK